MYIHKLIYIYILFLFKYNIINLCYITINSYIYISTKLCFIYIDISPHY